MDRKSIEATSSLEEAIKLLFNVDLNGRIVLFPEEGMQKEVAQAYNQLGLSARRETYRHIAEDFKVRTGCYGANHPLMSIGTIVEVGCGSGLLSLELAEQTNGKIRGIDVSADMLELSYQNAVQRQVERRAEQEAFRVRYPQLFLNSPNPHDTPLCVEFRLGTVYNLIPLVPEQDINYIVCRNTLHRFKDPQTALRSMYDTLAPGGKIYLRDLKRDALWNIILKRIGPRWETSILVEDYIRAMAGMFTVAEVMELLKTLPLSKSVITNGSYQSGSNTFLPEFEQEVEYVGIIEKPKT